MSSNDGRFVNEVGEFELVVFQGSVLRIVRHTIIYIKYSVIKFIVYEVNVIYKYCPSQAKL